MKDVKQIIYEVDTLLGRIRVSSDDVFLMADARQRLKIVFDILNAPKETKDAAEVTPDVHADV